MCTSRDPNTNGPGGDRCVAGPEITSQAEVTQIITVAQKGNPPRFDKAVFAAKPVIRRKL